MCRFSIKATISTEKENYICYYTKLTKPVVICGPNLNNVKTHFEKEIKTLQQIDKITYTYNLSVIILLIKNYVKTIKRSLF